MRRRFPALILLLASSAIVFLPSCTRLKSARAKGKGGLPGSKADLPPAPLPAEAPSDPLLAGSRPGETMKLVSAVPPKPLSPATLRGLSWLLRHQLGNGGFGQGEEALTQADRKNELADVANVAETSMAGLALLRSGSTPSGGPYAESLRKAVDFACGEVEAADAHSLSVTSLRGTRLQQKIGQYADTFLVACFLAEAKGTMLGPEAEARLGAALSKVLRKIEENQKADGGWEDRGWAPDLSRSMAGKALNRAAMKGVEVSEEVREKARNEASGRFNSAIGIGTGSGRTFGGRLEKSAGVRLYGVASSIGELQESASLEAERERSANEDYERARGTPGQAESRRKVERIRRSRSETERAKARLEALLDEPGFLEGFGSNGGEEYLSYMHLSESLVVDGGETWRKWDRRITETLERAQNEDGSWTGLHCITGRTFCTSAALLVLMADRVKIPLAAKIPRR